MEKVSKSKTKAEKKNIKKKKGSIKTQLLIMPLILLLVGLISIGFVSSHLTKKGLSDQMRAEGIFVSEQFSKKVSDNQESLETINFLLEDLIKGIGNTIITNQDQISNDYLKRIANDMDVDEINYTDASGEVTFSNLESSLGAVFGEDHISYAVLGEKQSELMEDIRGSRETDDHYKYGYILNPKGGMIQVGLLANNVNDLTEKFSYQVAVEEMASTENISYALYIDKDDKIIAHSNLDEVGSLIDDGKIIESLKNGEVYSAEGYNKEEDLKVYDIVYPIEINGEVVGAINIGYSMDSVESAILKNRNSIALLCLVIFIIIGAILYITISKSIGTINKIKERVGFIASGDLTVNLDQKLLEDNNEFGEIAIAVGNMQESIRNIIRQVINKSNDVSQSSESLTAASQQVAASAREISLTIEDIANGATEQTKDTQDVAESIDSMGRLIAEDEDHIRELNQSAKLIYEEKEEGFNMLKVLTEKTNQSTKSTEEIYDIIINNDKSAGKINKASNMIQDIADQTNLLALNAAIEAARAGEAGKGFSVVADEIRKLAEQSNIFASEIKEVITELETQSKDAVDTMEIVQSAILDQSQGVKETYGKFESIADAIDSINIIIGKLNESSGIMMENKNQVISLTQNLYNVSELNSAGIEESSAILQDQSINIEDIAEAGVELSNIAEELESTISKFKI